MPLESFRATKTTSAVAGVIIAYTGLLLEREMLPEWIVAAVYFGGTFLGVVGLPQYLEARREMKRRNNPVLMGPGDLRKFYIPVWSRVLIAVAAGGVTLILLHFLAI